MSSYLADRVLAAENVEVLHHTEIRRMHGGGRTCSVRIHEAWYEAFDVQPHHELYLPPEERVRIW